MLKRFCDHCNKELPREPIPTGTVSRQLPQDQGSVLILTLGLSSRKTVKGNTETSQDFCNECVVTLFENAAKLGWLKHDTGGAQHKPLLVQ